MYSLPDFTSLALLSGNAVHQVFRARRQRDDLAVILKVLDTLNTGREDLARLRHEFHMLSRLHHQGLVEALELLQQEHLTILVLADDQAEDLASVLNREKFPLPVALRLMLSATRAVGQAHQNGIIHRDINPSNLILLPNRVTLKLIDFGIAIQHRHGLREEGQTLALAGSLRYIAPEQTGKMNRQVDYRSDYYALGVTLYELLLGHPPFDSLDPHELIHAHIARRPIPPAEVDPNIPAIVSQLVMKLLAKNAEQRYQSARGLELDLQRCVDLLQLEGLEGLHNATWKLGEQDRSPRFSIPEKLYGRESELQILFRGFAKVRQGRKTLFLVSGNSGVGKTALVRELHKPVLDSNGILVFGKFDQLQRDIPYRGLVLALQQWTRQLLSASEKELQQWRLHLQKAVEGNGGLLVELIPELALVVEPQPLQQRVDPIQMQQLFNHVLLNFMGAIATAEHPLVLALDDLQWADEGSLHLMELLLSSEDISHLMLVGIYRDAEVDASHPLQLTIDTLRHRDSKLDAIQLEPLSLAVVTQLVQDTFGSQDEAARQLASIILEKTEGNPFYLEEFLASLVSEELLRFDFSSGQWSWESSAIQERMASLNVVALLVQRLHQLDPLGLQVLQIAACSGFEFLLADLLAVATCDPSDVFRALQLATGHNLVQPVGDAYLVVDMQPDMEMIQHGRLSFRFIHDRIQQAAYDSIEPASLPQWHQRIGRRLLDSLDAKEREAHIFDLVRHFNLAANLLQSDADKRVHLDINLQAARKAVEASGFDNAFRLLQDASEYLSAKCWQEDYAFALHFTLQLIEAAYLSEHYAQMDQHIAVMEQRVVNPTDMMAAYHVQMHALNRQGLAREAIDLGVDVAKLVGERVRRHPTRMDVMIALLSAKLYLWRHLRGRKMTQLKLQPAQVSPQDLLVYDHMFEIAELSFLARPNVFAEVVFDGVRRTVSVGVLRTTPGAYAAFGVLHCALLNQIEQGVDYMQFSLQAAEMVGDPYIRVTVTQLYNGFVRHWKEHLRESLKGLLWVHRHSTEIARLDFSCHGANMYLIHAWFAGNDIGELAVEAEKYGKLAHRYGYGNLALYAELLLQMIVCLQGRAEHAHRLKGSAFDETDFDAQAHEKIDGSLVLYFHLFKLQLGFFLGEAELALLHGEECLRLLDASPGAYANSQYYLFNALCHLQWASQQPIRRLVAIRHVRKALRKHQFWQRHCPTNFDNKVWLLQGALAQLQGQQLAAMQCYEKAAASARKHGFVQERAIACELSAQCAQQLNLVTAATDYLREAAVQYQKWGASEKVTRLRLVPTTQRRRMGVPNSLAATTRTIGSSALDMASLRKALKEIAEEKVHTRLVAKTIQAASRIAGSQNATLLLEKDGELRVEAQLTADMTAPSILQSLPLQDDMEWLAAPVVHFVARSFSSIVIADAQQLQEQIPGLNKVRCVQQRQVRSVMALPLLEGAQSEHKLIGVIYLENNLVTEAFTSGMIEALEIIGLAAAGRLELSRKAVTDGLTGLFNHDFFQQQITEQFHLATRYQRNLSVILLDIDHFKKFNDNWGHQVGDRVLKQVADTIRQCCRVSDVVARYGGEEMVVILPETEEHAAQQVAEKIRAAIEAMTVFHEGQELRVTSSLGVCGFSERVIRPEEMVRLADEALYACKAAGRNCVRAANTMPGN